MAVAEPADQQSTEEPDTPIAVDGFESAAAAEESETDPAANKKEGILERHKRYMDSAVQRSSVAVDEFFADENYEAESSETQLRVRPEFYYRQEQGGKLRLRVRARLHLPTISERLSLIAGRDPDTDNFDEESVDDGSNSVAGLQYFLRSGKNWNTSLSAGVRTNEFSVYFGPRIRYQTSLSDHTGVRFTQTLRWQTNNHWDIGSRLDLNFLPSESLYFRQTFYGRWRGERADEEGYRTSVSSVLSQRVGNSAGLQYEFKTVVFTQPDLHVDEYLLSIRYRKKTRRDWLYYEIAPQVSFEDEFDYQANFGIRLRVEFFYGAPDASRHWKKEIEDTEEFTW